jgi:hypothetical protein
MDLETARALLENLRGPARYDHRRRHPRPHAGPPPCDRGRHGPARGGPGPPSHPEATGRLRLARSRAWNRRPAERPGLGGARVS